MPFDILDSDGDGAEELYLKAGTACAGMIADSISGASWAVQTTSTTGCRDAAPYDAGKHYATDSSEDCP